MLGLEKSRVAAVLGGEKEWVEAEDGSDSGGGVPIEERVADPKEGRPVVPNEGRPSMDWRKEPWREVGEGDEEGCGLAPPGLLTRLLRRSRRYAAMRRVSDQMISLMEM